MAESPKGGDSETAPLDSCPYQVFMQLLALENNIRIGPGFQAQLPEQRRNKRREGSLRTRKLWSSKYQQAASLHFTKFCKLYGSARTLEDFAVLVRRAHGDLTQVQILLSAPDKPLARVLSQREKESRLRKGSNGG